MLLYFHEKQLNRITMIIISIEDCWSKQGYCDDLMRFGIEPQMIIADEEATADEKSWWVIPVNTVEALTQYKNEQFLSIVPIDRWLEGNPGRGGRRRYHEAYLQFQGIRVSLADRMPERRHRWIYL